MAWIRIEDYAYEQYAGALAENEEVADLRLEEGTTPVSPIPTVTPVTPKLPVDKGPDGSDSSVDEEWLTKIRSWLPQQQQQQGPGRGSGTGSGTGKGRKKGNIELIVEVTESLESFMTGGFLPPKVNT
jgi:hypothetical protein